MEVVLRRSRRRVLSKESPRSSEAHRCGWNTPDVAAATRVAEGVAPFLGSTPLRLENASPAVTVTIGICTATQPSLSSDLFEAADRALFAGKARGRNTIEIVSI